MEAEPVGHNPPRRRRGRASAGARASRSPPADSTPGAAASCSRLKSSDSPHSPHVPAPKSSSLPSAEHAPVVDISCTGRPKAEPSIQMGPHKYQLPCNLTPEEEPSAHQPDLSQISVQAETELQLQPRVLCVRDSVNALNTFSTFEVKGELITDTLWNAPFRSVDEDTILLLGLANFSPVNQKIKYIFYFNFCISFKPGIICGVALKKPQETGGFWYPLRRGSSFTFLTPGSHWDFTLKRKRREKEDDVVSLCSLDFKEPSNKRVRPLARVTSLANLISPVRNGAVRRFGQTIQSFALRSDKSPSCAQKSCSRSAAPTPPKRRNSVLWSETLDVNMKESLSTKEIKRQEAIYEMSRGEQDLIEDLKLARKAYHDPMLKLSIMSEEELTHIFGDLDSYIPLHEDLLASLGEATKPDGTVEQIGPILVKWLPRLHAYKGYCSNQLAAKALLDQKKQDRRVQDFLQRCLESPFSRKLDLWSFLDIPRSRLVKYPLLLKEILRHTPKDHPDIQILEEAISIIQGVLSDINLKKGESECQYYIDKLEYLDEKQKDPRIEGSKVLLCHGELKNKNGHKLYVFLFQDILVLTRPVTRNERQAYQVYRQPIPVQELLLEDLQDGDVKMGGSFRGAFGNSDKAKNIFRVRFQDPSPGQSHTLQANDVFHKQQWVNCIRTAVAPFQRTAATAELKELPELSEESEENNPSASNVRAHKRQSAGAAEMELDENASECGSILDSEEAKGAKTHRTSFGHRKTRDKQLSGKRKETLV